MKAGSRCRRIEEVAMPKVHFLPEEKMVEVVPGTTLLEAAKGAGIPHACMCGGNCRCTTCRVMILEGLDRLGPRTADEEKLLGPLELHPSVRLACRAKVAGDVTVRRLVIDDEDARLISLLNRDLLPISGGEEKKIAILFADIRDFTPFSAAIQGYDVLHVLNRYFHRMAVVIEQHGGYVDNYMGDGLLALFGVEDSEKAALRAVRAGYEMLGEVERFRSYLDMMYRRHFQIGVGIHYGPAVIGVLGACNRRRKTAIGESVNMASRIEGVNKACGTNLLISEELFREVEGRVLARPLDPLCLKGIEGERTLYEVSGVS
jgi:adenylate cyclase